MRFCEQLSDFALREKWGPERVVIFKQTCASHLPASQVSLVSACCLSFYIQFALTYDWSRRVTWGVWTPICGKSMTCANRKTHHTSWQQVQGISMGYGWLQSPPYFWTCAPCRYTGTGWSAPAAGCEPGTWMQATLGKLSLWDSGFDHLWTEAHDQMRAHLLMESRERRSHRPTTCSTRLARRDGDLLLSCSSI